MLPRRRSIPGLVLVLAAMSGAATARGQVERPRTDGMRTISVQGSASAFVAPDVAQITVGAETRGPTAREALAANNRAMAALMDMLKQRGVAARDVQTTDLTLSPVYDKPLRGRGDAEVDKTPPRIIGYEIRNTIRITFREVTKVGDLLDATVKAGVNKVERLSFEVSDPRPTLRELRKKALADAKTKAEEVAREAGMALGPPVSIDVDQSTSLRHSYMSMMGSSRDNETVPIAPGEEKLEAAVGVVYELKPPG